MYKVLVVDDQLMVRELIEAYLEESNIFVQVGSIPNAALAELFCIRTPVDLVLMDVCTQNNESGFEATRKIKNSFPNTKVLIMTSMLDFDYIKRAREVGADSLWFKEGPKHELFNVMKKTMQGEEVYPDCVPEVSVGLCFNSDFTPAEIRVLRLLVEGMTYKEIAEDLYISPQTVKDHVSRMLQKTGFSSKTKLAAEVASKRLIVNGF